MSVSVWVCILVGVGQKLMHKFGIFIMDKFVLSCPSFVPQWNFLTFIIKLKETVLRSIDPCICNI